MSQRDRVLTMLQRGPCTTGDFLRAYVPRFSARIQELRAEGFEIETGRVRDGEYRYRLVDEPDADLGGEADDTHNVTRTNPSPTGAASARGASGPPAAELSANSDESQIADLSSGTTSAPGGGAETLFELPPTSAVTGRPVETRAA